jgi:hypothetical protein
MRPSRSRGPLPPERARTEQYSPWDDVVAQHHRPDRLQRLSPRRPGRSASHQVTIGAAYPPALHPHKASLTLPDTSGAGHSTPDRTRRKGHDRSGNGLCDVDPSFTAPRWDPILPAVFSWARGLINPSRGFQSARGLTCGPAATPLDRQAGVANPTARTGTPTRRSRDWANSSCDPYPAADGVSDGGAGLSIGAEAAYE